MITEPLDEPPHPIMSRVLDLNAKAAKLQIMAEGADPVERVGLAFRAELVRESRRIALDEVMGGDGG